MDLSNAVHVGVLVKDMDKAMEYYQKEFNIGPWEDFGELHENAVYNGVPHTLNYRAAMAPLGGMRMELIQPTGGASIFQDDLDANGEGIHHICIQVDDVNKAEEEAKAQGYHVLEKIPMYEMNPGFSLGFFFIDSDKRGGIKFEIVQEVVTEQPAEE